MAFCRYLTTKNQPLTNVPNGPNTAEKGRNLQQYMTMFARLLDRLVTKWP
nr:MAG TPA: hypothetical protein [Caudoviricetes sp.]